MNMRQNYRISHFIISRFNTYMFYQIKEFLPFLSSSAGEIHVQSDLNLEIDLGNLRLSISLPL